LFKIFDCSNSDERPSHRGGGGPIMNDIMRYLHENAASYNFQFVDIASDADVIITNDVFPSSVVGLGIPLVKRMCGPFWQKDLQARNEPLNKAARLANKVIFITEYSKKQYLHCYQDNLQNYTVVKHWADSAQFNDRYCNKPDVFTFIACATDWGRKEKRLIDLLTFANIYSSDCNLNLIGRIDDNIKLPDNVYKFGYLEEHGVWGMMNVSNAFINFSYRDAATKTVPQAISCGLPVLFADSGGVYEMAGEYGIGIKDSHSLDIENDVPRLKYSALRDGHDKFFEMYSSIKLSLRFFDRRLAFNNMLEGYFSAIESVLK